MTPEEETFNKLQEPAPVIDENGNKRWFNGKGELHRDNDLPAVDAISVGIKYWYKDGLRHRDNDLPAITCGNVASFYWYKNDKLHRENGLPAVVYFNGSEEYWENGIQII